MGAFFYDIVLPVAEDQLLSVIPLNGIRDGRRLRFLGDLTQKELFLLNGEHITGPYRSGTKAAPEITWMDALLGVRAELAVVDRRPSCRRLMLPQGTGFVHLPDGRQMGVDYQGTLDYTLRVSDARALVEAYVEKRVGDPTEDLDAALSRAAAAELDRAFARLSPLSLPGLQMLPGETEDALLRRMADRVPGLCADDLRLQLDIFNRKELEEALNRPFEDQRRKEQMVFEAILQRYPDTSRMPEHMVQMVCAYFQANPGADSAQIGAVVGKLDVLCQSHGPEAVWQTFQRLLPGKT